MQVNQVSSHKELLSVDLRMEKLKKKITGLLCQRVKGMKTLLTLSWTQMPTMMREEEGGPYFIPFMVK